MSNNRSVPNDGTPIKEDLPYMLYRMDEPVFFPKGDDPKERRFFEITPDYLPDEMKSRAPQLLSQYSSDQEEGRRVFLGDIENALLRIPLDEVKAVSRYEQFSPFIPLHQRAAGRLLSIFLELKTINDLIKFAGYSRDRVNGQLFAYAYSTALVHRNDTKDLWVPSAAEVFPRRFVENGVVAGCRKESNLYENANDRSPVEIPPDATGNDGDSEHRMAYWREDLGVNLHHWHWHLVYPFQGPEAVVRKDRRGELFYFIHQQIIARYNVERICNNLNLVHRLQNWDEPIREAYYPMLSSDVAGRDWPGRAPNMRMSNINLPDLDVRFDIEDMKRYRDRIFEAINRKSVISSDGSSISLDNVDGIDVLGNMVEASILTPNAEYYGNLHNMGHTALAFINDPQGRYQQPPGVMSEVSTAMRDPVFYRWHAFINDIFEEHKDSLRPYETDFLSFPGVQVTSVELCSFENGTCRSEKNSLYTHMMKSDINMSRGVDFFPRGPVLVRVTHLNHDEFEYNIEYVNSTQSQLLGTVRIFLIPMTGYGNHPLKLDQSRRLAIEMDRFMQPLSPGRNRIHRRSTMSSVTIPFEQSFRDLDTNRPDENQYRESDRFNFCGCGWPQHLLVPRGTSNGFPMVLFAMITDFNIDRVDADGFRSTDVCKAGFIFCGLRDKKYPDRRPMGFPFDRPPRYDAGSIDAFLTPNMAFKRINIYHSNEVRRGRLLTDNPPTTLRAVREEPNQNQ